METDVAKPWFRLYSEFVSDPKVQLLAFEDQRHFIAVLCLKCNETLDSQAVSDEFRERMISRALGLDIASAVEVKRRLCEVGLIHPDWQPVKWESRQYQSDSSADRTRKWRERHSDVTVTDKSRAEQSRTEQREGASAPQRATRLPADFSLTPERRIVAEAEKQNPERTFQAFTDYWKAASGQSARKMDWDATWRNWCRRQADFSPKKAESGRASNIPSATNETDLLIARAARIGFRAQIPGEPMFRYEDALKEAERKAQPRPQPKFATVNQ